MYLLCKVAGNKKQKEGSDKFRSQVEGRNNATCHPKEMVPSRHIHSDDNWGRGPSDN